MTFRDLEKGYIVLMIIGIFSIAYLVISFMPSSITTGSIAGEEVQNTVSVLGFPIKDIIIFSQGMAGSFLGFLGFLEMRRINKKLDRKSKR